MPDTQIKNQIQGYVGTGKILMSETLTTLEALDKATNTPKFLVNIFEFATKTRVKKKRTWESIWRIWGGDPHYRKLDELQSRFQVWFNDVIDFIGTISIDKRTLTIRGNTDELLKKFNRPKSLKSLDKKIKYTLIALESILQAKLIYNKDIPRKMLQKEIKKGGKKRSIYRSNARSILSELRGFPEVKESIQGAIERLDKMGYDYQRQALSSCRIALESLVRQISNVNDWSKGLREIISSRADRDIVKKAYGYLCKYGPHNSEIPTHSEAEIGFNLTLTSIAIILNNYN